jgi:hypothetical protein
MRRRFITASFLIRELITNEEARLREEEEEAQQAQRTV